MGNGIDGFLDALTDRDALMDMGLGLAGGAAGGVAFQFAEANLAFLNSGSQNTALLKKLGAATALAFGAGMLAGDGKGPQAMAAKGWVGGVGAQVGSMLMNRFAPTALAPSAEVIAARAGGAAPQGTAQLAAVRSSRIQLAQRQLASARVYSGQDIPANVGGVHGLGRVNVTTKDPAELASMMSVVS